MYLLLLVEDNNDEVELIQKMLTERAPKDFNIHKAATLEEGLAEVTRGHVDVILLDLWLPDSQGLETFRNLYQQTAGAAPIVILSDQTEINIAVQAVRAGAQDYLVKGHFDENYLVRTLHFAIARHQRSLEDRGYIPPVGDQLQQEMRRSFLMLQDTLREARHQVSHLKDEAHEVTREVRDLNATIVRPTPNQPGRDDSPGKGDVGAKPGNGDRNAAVPG
jgi:DNA-binding response OmpR family regulator